MKLPLFIGCVFLLVPFGYCRTNIIVHTPMSDGMCLSTPLRIAAGSPFDWTVLVCNPSVSTALVEVVTTAKVKTSGGGELFSLARYATTNHLPPAGTQRLSFLVGSGWTADNPLLDSIQIAAGVLNRDTDEFSVSWYDARVVFLPSVIRQTNSSNAVEFLTGSASEKD